MAPLSLTRRERYLRTVRNEPTDRPPIWLMRQAGRYMPEYRKLRERYTFLDFCKLPEVSAEATLQPFDILDVDILIIFNDILIPLEDMGLRVEFPETGPAILNPVQTAADVAALREATFSDPPVSQALRKVKEHTGPDVPILGFCGSPFTLAAYAIEGKVTRSQHIIKEFRFRHPDLLHRVMEKITTTAAAYLVSQIREGKADGVQIFESWGGILGSPRDYEEFAARYQRLLIAEVRKSCPDTPIHLFVKGSAPVLDSMATSGADVLSIDWCTSMSDARLRTTKAIQGNLDPTALHVPEAVEAEVLRMIEGFNWRRGWIANLGHGILPQASVEGAKRFVQTIKGLADRS